MISLCVMSKAEKSIAWREFQEGGDIHIPMADSC